MILTSVAGYLRLVLLLVSLLLGRGHAISLMWKEVLRGLRLHVKECWYSEC